MDFKNKYIKYKTKYLLLKNIDTDKQVGGGKKEKKCYIDDTDKILFGDGGSSSIIIITKNKKVYKIFTTFHFEQDIEAVKQIKNNNIRVENEIKIYELPFPLLN